MDLTGRFLVSCHITNKYFMAGKKATDKKRTMFLNKVTAD